jgi:hypothetical protein
VTKWKPVPGLEESYEVSDRGQVRSLDRIIRYSTGQMVFYSGKELKPQKAPSRKYWSISLDGKNRDLHVLILTTFRGERPEGMEGCHNDGNRNHNWLSNLRWDTHPNNLRDRTKHGYKGQTKTVGTLHPLAKLTSEQVREIRRRYVKGRVSQTFLANEYGVSQRAVSSIVLGKHRKYA